MPIQYPGNAITKEARAKTGGGFESAIGVAIVTDWQLPASNYIAAKRPLQIIQPHPTQIGSDSIYLWAEPGERYEVPICAIFGAYPYHFSVDGPDEMTVGSFLALDSDGVTLIRPDGYGVVSFDVPVSGMTSFSYTITVTDQQLNTASVTVNVAVDANKFIHLAPLGQGVGDGSAGNPLGSFRDVWKDDVSDATYAGKILRIHGGNYTLFGDPVNSNTNVDLNGNLKPKVWVNKHGETPVFDCSQAKILFGGGNMDDCAFSGIEFKNSRTDVPDSQFIWANNTTQRPLIWRNKFTNLLAGTAGDDNQSCIFIPSAGTKNSVIKDNIGNGVVGAIYDTYNVSESLFEGNEVKNCTSAQSHFNKGQMVYSTVRHEKAIENVTGNTAFEWYMSQAQAIYEDGRSHDNEFCYNVGVASGNRAAKIAGGSTSDQHYNQWCYRNTFDGLVQQLYEETSEWEYEQNAYTDGFPSGTAVTLTDNRAVPTAEIVNGLLSGSSDSLIGQYGHQISAETA